MSRTSRILLPRPSRAGVGTTHQGQMEPRFTLVDVNQAQDQSERNASESKNLDATKLQETMQMSIETKDLKAVFNDAVNERLSQHPNVWAGDDSLAVILALLARIQDSKGDLLSLTAIETGCAGVGIPAHQQSAGARNSHARRAPWRAT